MGVLSPLKLFLPVKWVAGLMVLFFAWQGVVFFKQRNRQYTAAEKVAIERVCEKARVLSANALDVSLDKPVQLGVAPLLIDASGYFTDTLIAQLPMAPGLEVLASAEAREHLAILADALRKTANLNESIVSGGTGFDSLVWGRVEEVYEDEGIGYAVLDYHLYDFRKSAWVLAERIKADSRERAGSWLRRNWKIFFACLSVILLPLLNFRLLEKTADKNSNTASAILLVGLISVDLLLFWWAGFYALPIAVPILGILFAIFYNLWACDFVTKRIYTNP